MRNTVAYIPLLGGKRSLLVANCSRIILANSVGDREILGGEEEDTHDIYATRNKTTTH